MLISAVLAVALGTASGEERLPLDVALAAVTSLLGTSRDPESATICLFVDGIDPSQELREALMRASVEIVPGSNCRYEGQPGRRVKAVTSTGGAAEFLRLSAFSRKGPGKVEIDYERRSGSWTGRGSTLVLELRSGRWNAQDGPRYEWVE